MNSHIVSHTKIGGSGERLEKDLGTSIVDRGALAKL
jgi:hypothetical protein